MGVYANYMDKHAPFLFRVFLRLVCYGKRSHFISSKGLPMHMLQHSVNLYNYTKGRSFICSCAAASSLCNNLNMSELTSNAGAVPIFI